MTTLPTQTEIVTPVQNATGTLMSHAELALWISEPTTLEVESWIDNEEICCTFRNGEVVRTVRFTYDFKIVQI